MVQNMSPAAGSKGQWFSCEPARVGRVSGAVAVAYVAMLDPELEGYEPNILRMMKMLALTQSFSLISVWTGHILAANICGISRRLRTLYTSHAARATPVDGYPAIACPVLSHGDGVAMS